MKSMTCEINHDLGISRGADNAFDLGKDVGERDRVRLVGKRLHVEALLPDPDGKGVRIGHRAPQRRETFRLIHTNHDCSARHKFPRMTVASRVLRCRPAAGPHSTDIPLMIRDRREG